ncbi:MAG: ABC transporter ATP-binding protein [Tissierellia bacterium]|nr:ABC transporter ATP-binding protein [Bacillota bacterium]NLL23275.1 ABC transporter ATP-binding protein [Tissierellia bacterium]
MLRIRQLTKRYGDKVAVENVDLHVEAGKITAFIGHNGAGKTTTLKCSCGILDFDEGEIEINGISIKERPVEAKKQLAYIPDNPNLYEYLSGIKYLEFIADVFGIDEELRRERIEEYSQLFGLRSELGNKIGTYSHGMKQKLAVISALIHAPKLMMLDEPFVGLDPVATHQLKVLMRQMCDRGSAIFFSTHILEVAEKLCDHVIIIRNGKIVVAGTMEEVRGDTSLENVFLELEEQHV